MIVTWPAVSPASDIWLADFETIPANNTSMNL